MTDHHHHHHHHHHHSPPPASDDVFQTLLRHLHPLPSQRQELAILPSSISSPNIQYDRDPPALAVPKALLLSCFLRARSIFFSTKDGALESTPSSRVQAALIAFQDCFRATSIILLWEPNHLTAANWRKRHLLNLASACDVEIELFQTLRAEMDYLTSLLTSPLPSQFAKSPTLWSHRLWLLRAFVFRPRQQHHRLTHTVRVPRSSTIETPFFDHSTTLGQITWKSELSVVVEAGDRHPRNYYAWSYARDLWRDMCSQKDDYVEGHRNEEQEKDVSTRELPLYSENSPEEEGPRYETEHPWPHRKANAETWITSIRRIQQWCFLHPRDISGWSFLVFLLHHFPTEPSAISRDSQRDELSTARPLAQQINLEIRQSTLDFVKKYSWEGESLSWFLKALEAQDVSCNAALS